MMIVTDVKDYVLNRYGSGLNLYRPVPPYPSHSHDISMDVPVYNAGVEEIVEPYGINRDKRSWLGTLVWSDMLLRYDNIEVYFETVLFDVSQSKNIVKTSLQGRNGTIKEYISDGDYVVNVRAALVSKGSKAYPESEVRNLITLLQIPYGLEVISPLLQAFDIYNVVVEDYALPSTNGFTNMQLVEMNCISDSPLVLLEDDTTNG